MHLRDLVIASRKAIQVASSTYACIISSPTYHDLQRLCWKSCLCSPPTTLTSDILGLLVSACVWAYVLEIMRG